MTPERVISEVCISFGVTEEELTGPARTKDINIPRMIAYMVMRDTFGLPSAAIGASLGRTRTTVVKALGRARWYAAHPDYSETVEVIKRQAMRCPWVDRVPFKSSRNTAAQALQ